MSEFTYLMHVFNDYAVAMYDCNAQKCVAVFRSKAIASRYVFGKAGRVTNSTITEKRATIPANNPYRKKITFRVANAEQIALLPKDEACVILDDAFIIKDALKEKLKVLQASVEPDPNILKKEIVGLSADGYSPDEIASKLNISGSTCRAALYLLPHVTNAMSKLSISEIESLIPLLKKRILLIKAQ